MVRDEPCRHGAKPGPCCREHIWPNLGTAVNKLYRCPVCDEYLLGVNPGNKGRRIVWGCFSGCDAKLIRDYLEGLRIDGSCLGGWLADKRDMPRTPRPGPDPATAADAERWRAMRKLSAAARDSPAIGGNLNLFLMCVQAIEDGDGDSGDPEQILGDADFLALAKRTGIGRSRYVLYERWLSRRQRDAS